MGFMSTDPQDYRDLRNNSYRAHSVGLTLCRSQRGRSVREARFPILECWSEGQAAPLTHTRGGVCWDGDR